MAFDSAQADTKMHFETASKGDFLKSGPFYIMLIFPIIYKEINFG
jgi:hypothetical protein